MSFGIKREKDKLALRLTRSYAGLFAAVFLLLTAMVYLVFYRFLIRTQSQNLATTLELTVDHILEEMEEGEAITDPGVLEEQNTSTNLSFYVQDRSGETLNRVLNFPLDEKDAAQATAKPRLIFDRNGTMLLCCAENVEQDGSYYGRLYMVQSLRAEQSFLKVLGILLLFANLIGACAALLVGKTTSHRMLAPIDSMITAANHIDESNLAERLDVPEPDDELKSLALTINSMLDRVSEAYRQQGRFVADVSHELRTPLAVMQGNVDLIARWGSKEPEVLADSLRALERQTEYMEKLVENLLFLARCDDARQQPNRTRFSVKSLFEELLEEQSLIDPAHRYRMTMETQDCLLTADRAMMHQVLRALMDNSVKYTPEGGEIELLCSLQPEGVAIAVSDTGSGIAEEHLPHIFERFYRVDKARARATGGTGLGLSIVQAIAEAHGGSVKAESVPGKGTTITLLLPNAETEEQPSEE